jgi:hypothetical protein
MDGRSQRATLARFEGVKPLIALSDAQAVSSRESRHEMIPDMGQLRSPSTTGRNKRSCLFANRAPFLAQTSRARI